MPEHTVAAGLARSLVGLAVSKGADGAALIREAGIEAPLLDDQDNRVPFAAYVRLMRAAKVQTGDEALALHYGESINLSEISILGLICHGSETMLHAFEQMNRYGRLVVEADHVTARDRFSLERRDGSLWLVDNRAGPPDFPELVETTFALMVCGTRPFGKTPFVHEVHLTHRDPGYRDEYERVLGAPVHFGMCWNALRIDDAWLTNRVSVQPRYVFGVLSERAEGLVRELERSRTMRGRVEALLALELHTGGATATNLARCMGLSRQTLSRRLRDEGTTLEKVLDELRRSLAIHYLEGRKVSVNETAYLVGFSDPSAFSRAFKRWTGMAPSLYRGRSEAKS